ncbi:hypothetical protein D3C73_1544310 [compost metagenome]
MPAAKIGAAASNESIRSSTPPCPGRIRPESLIPARRLIIDSNKSPKTELKTVTTDKIKNRIC